MSDKVSRDDFNPWTQMEIFVGKQAYKKINERFPCYRLVSCRRVLDKLQKRFMFKVHS